MRNTVRFRCACLHKDDCPAEPHKAREFCSSEAEIPTGSEVTPEGWASIGAGKGPGGLMCGPCAKADPSGGSVVAKPLAFDASGGLDVEGSLQ
jgi:hypothetical protein